MNNKVFSVILFTFSAIVFTLVYISTLKAFDRDLGYSAAGLAAIFAVIFLLKFSETQRAPTGFILKSPKWVVWCIVLVVIPLIISIIGYTILYPINGITEIIKGVIILILLVVTWIKLAQIKKIVPQEKRKF